MGNSRTTNGYLSVKALRAECVRFWHSDQRKRTDAAYSRGFATGRVVYAPFASLQAPRPSFVEEGAVDSSVVNTIVVARPSPPPFRNEAVLREQTKLSRSRRLVDLEFPEGHAQAGNNPSSYHSQWTLGGYKPANV